MNTSKQKHKTFGRNFPDLKRCSLDDFHKYKMSMGLYNGKKPVDQL